MTPDGHIIMVAPSLRTKHYLALYHGVNCCYMNLITKKWINRLGEVEGIVLLDIKNKFTTGMAHSMI
jgi:pyruvate kinase